MENLENKTALILGAARQGQALARYMGEHGVRLIITDAKSFDQLAPAREALADLNPEWVCGSHPLTLLDRVDLVCVTAGADLRIPILQEALTRGIPVINDACIFFEDVKNPIIGITGSSGKTTTTTLLGRMAKACEAANSKTWVGGNIGLAMLSFISDIQPHDRVILELSSFQLELLRRSPHIGAILNITPNHLDRHETMENYTAAKMNILSHQTADDIAVLSRDDSNAWAQRVNCQGKVYSFGFTEPCQTESDAAVYVQNDEIRLRTADDDSLIMRTDLIQLRGRHNLLNVMAACALAAAAGFPKEAMCAGVEGFKGVDHRLQWVRNYRGADWYNDSIATAPERALAAVHSYSEPLVMLLGGRDKKLPWGDLAAKLHTRARACVLFGEAAPMIHAALEVEFKENGPQIIDCANLKDAVHEAAKIVQPGDVVLLSPGGTSYDAFRDFEERGRLFTQWVLELK